MKFILSKQIKEGKLFLNIVDLELKGKVLENDSTKINLTKDYYQGVETDKQKIIQLLEQAHSIQFIGNNSVKLGQQHNLVNTISEIESVKYAFVIKM